MARNNDDDSKSRDKEIERDILSGRKFSLAEAVGREGGELLKGESPVPEMERIAALVKNAIDEGLFDPSGAIKMVLEVIVDENHPLLWENREKPLEALKGLISSIIDNRGHLEEFVRRVDFKWGQISFERPHFQKQGDPPHPDDEYTIAHVKKTLRDFLQNLI